MSSPFGGPGSGGGGGDSRNDYRSNLGYGSSTLSAPSDYSGAGQTPFSNAGFGSESKIRNSDGGNLGQQTDAALGE